MLPRSSVPGIAWPALPAQPAALLLAVEFQLAESQWWSPAAIREQQFRQAAILLAYAVASVPLYRECLAGNQWNFERDGMTKEAWMTLPILQRNAIQRNGDALRSQKLPPGHGHVIDYTTSGSTGRPISFSGTELTHFFWKALTLRDHLWHRRNLGGKLATIRTTVDEGEGKGWGPATDEAFSTGPCATLNIRTDVASQARWLERQDPHYLLSHPSNVMALALHCIESGIRLPQLRQVRTFGETLLPGLRERCLEAWGASLVDVYSAEEVGYIALQCPECEHYHLQAENLLVEILDDKGKDCAPGEIGKVVVTTLHNFAMPLIRYEIGDYAEVGAPCACGRGLPVVKRIMGRQRNMLTLPDGRQHWPSFPAEGWLPIAPVRQFQLIQRELETIEARFVADRIVTAEEKQRLTVMLHQYLGYPFRIHFVQMDKIERKPNCKFEDFISEVSRQP